MKNNILYFIIGLMVIPLMAAQSDNFQLFVPKTPKSVIVKHIDGVNNYYGNRAVEFIRSKVSEGYIVKTVSQNDYNIIIVLEKY